MELERTMRLTNRVQVHHLMQEELALILQPLGLLGVMEVSLLNLVLNKLDFLFESVQPEEIWAQSDVMVPPVRRLSDAFRCEGGSGRDLPSPSVVCPSIATNTLAVNFFATPALRILAAGDYVEFLVFLEILETVEIICDP